MRDLQSELAGLIHRYAINDGSHTMPIQGMYCVKFSHKDNYAKRRWKACLGIVAQGSKEIVLGDKVYRCDAAHYTASPIVLPVISRIATASFERPFLAVLIELDPLILHEIASQLETALLTEVECGAHAIFVGEAQNKMLEASIRLLKLCENSMDAQVLGPLVIRELFYYLLKGENGKAINQFVRSGSKMHRISHAIHSLRADLSSDFDIEDLAKVANMSRSAFFKCFKELTTMSPIQYQKRLRLLEARRLMLEEGKSAETSSYVVGYKSASQFNREYSRMFGDSPLRNVMKAKTELSNA